MRIESLRTEMAGGRKRVAATVIWEDCQREPYDLYFETPTEFGDSLICNPDAFLTGCMVPAWEYGEKRVALDGAVCPELRAGLVTTLSWLRLWYRRGDGAIPRIEAPTREEPRRPVAERSALFFSGGVDSFAILRKNRLGVSPRHPRYFREGVVAFGLEVEDAEAFGHLLNHLTPVAKEAGISLIPVYTSVYLPYREEDAARKFFFWSRKLHGAALAAIAHSLAGRLSAVSIAATGAVPFLRYLGLNHISPFGTHPLLDSSLGSTELRILHDGIELSRYDRTRLISDWDLALNNLRVCNQFRQYRSGSLNCGKCEKCVRTKLALLALGALDRTSAFADRDVSPEFVSRAVEIAPFGGDHHTRAMYYQELLAPLAQAGKAELVHVLTRKLQGARNRGRLPAWMQQADRKVAGLRRRARQVGATLLSGR